MPLVNMKHMLQHACENGYAVGVEMNSQGLNATLDYDIPSINRQGSVPIERIAADNIALCEALLCQ